MARTRDPVYLAAIERLRQLFQEAHERGLMEANAASLATADLRGRPTIRTVSVASIEPRGPVFFVDSRSGKGRQLDDNPCAALCFHWPELYQQVVVEGHVEAASRATSDRCWALRPRERQLAAWIDEPRFQCDPGTTRDPLASVRDHFASDPIPRPAHWQGLHLRPGLLLFWKPGWRHLHTRERYAPDAAGRWNLERMRPFYEPGAGGAA